MSPKRVCVRLAAIVPFCALVACSQEDVNQAIGDWIKSALWFMAKMILISLEDLSEEEVEALQQHYRRLVELAKRDKKLTQSHTVEEAVGRHEVKLRAVKKVAGTSV